MSEVITLAADLETQSNAAKRERETVFNVGKAEALARKRLRPELKQRQKIAGLPKPDEAEAVLELKRRKVRRAKICETLRITPEAYAACARYWKACKVERETRELETHASLVHELVNMAYIAWRFANFEGWKQRQDKAAAQGKPCNPESVEQAVKYAFGRYFRNERKRNNAKNMQRKAARGARPVGALLLDLPESMKEQTKTVCRLLAHDTSKAEAADLLSVSRPRVSQIVKQLETLPVFVERAALLGILPQETRAALEQAEARREFAAEIANEQREQRELTREASRAACRGYVGSIRQAWRCDEFAYSEATQPATGCKVRQAIRASLLVRYAAKRYAAKPATLAAEVVETQPVAADLAALRLAMPDNFLPQGIPADLAALLERADIRRAEAKQREIDMRNLERAAK